MRSADMQNFNDILQVFVLLHQLTDDFLLLAAVNEDDLHVMNND